MCPSCRLSEHCQLIKTLVETVESLKEEVQQLKQCKLFPPTRGNPDVVGKDHDQEASGVNVSGVEEEEISREVGVAEEEKVVNQTELLLIATTVHIKTRVNQSQGSGYETGEKNIRPRAEPYGSPSQDRARGKGASTGEKKDLGHTESMQLKCSNANNLSINRHF